MKSVLFLVLVGMSAGASAKMASEYTSVATNDCKTIASSQNEVEPEIDYYTGHCEGRAGFTTIVSGGDIRYSLSLLYRGEEINFTEIRSFHDMGSDLIEWRGIEKNGKIEEYTSLIYRLKISTPDAWPDKPLSQDNLFVVRLNGIKSCLVGIVPQSSNMNERARAIADMPSLRCLGAVN